MYHYYHYYYCPIHKTLMKNCKNKKNEEENTFTAIMCSRGLARAYRAKVALPNHRVRRCAMAHIAPCRSKSSACNFFPLCQSKLFGVGSSSCHKPWCLL